LVAKQHSYYSNQEEENHFPISTSSIIHINTAQCLQFFW